MDTQKDFRELLELFNSSGVEYVIVGAHGLAFHGVPPYTGDLDLWVRPDEQNAKRVMKAPKGLGFGSVGLTEGDFQAPGKVVQLGHPPLRIDILTSITGVSWEDADSRKVAGSYGSAPVYNLGRAELLANKRACGRKKDLADIEALGGK